MHVPELLRQIPLFADLDDAALERLAARSGVRTYPAGQVLFTAGEPCRGLYVVAVGPGQDLPHEPVRAAAGAAQRGPGRPVAELPLFDGGAYPASAETEVESRLALVPRNDFEALYRESPDAAAAIIQALARRLRHLVHVTETLAFRDVAAPLAVYLADYADEHGRDTPDGIEITLAHTREALAIELGTARESVSRALKQLTLNGVIEPLGRKRLRIRDADRLRTLASPGGASRFD